jgi:hypothetical protein
MYPDRDSRADRLDEALERRLNGDDITNDDPELQELLDLSARLEQTLPDDLPDPAFRHNLKQQLLSQPQPSLAEPVDLARERFHRRLAGSTWRLSAAAAAFLIVILVAVVMAMGPMSGDSDDDMEEQPASLQGIGDDYTTPEQDVDTFDTDDRRTVEPEWVNATLPPFDTNHVVLNPLLGMPLGMPAPKIEPLVAFDDDAEMPDMPETAPVYYFSAPPNPEALISSVQRALGIEGELEPGSAEDGTPYRLINDSGQTIVKWDPGSAFFHYIGRNADPEFTGYAEPGSDPSDISESFLETIGFDLYSVDYVIDVEVSGSETHIRFKASSLPEMGLDVWLGAVVVIDEDDQVAEARMMWLSLIGVREATLRPPGETWDLGERGHGFWPPHEAPDGRVLVEVLRTKMVYLLTRHDHATYVLQPAVKFVGRYSDDDDDDPTGPARYYVPAIDNED